MEIAVFRTLAPTRMKPSEHGDIEEVDPVDPWHRNGARRRLVDWRRRKMVQRTVAMSATVAAGRCLDPVLSHHIFALTCLIESQTKASGDVKAAGLLALRPIMVCLS
jgi:hypothetical protein